MSLDKLAVLPPQEAVKSEEKLDATARGKMAMVIADSLDMFNILPSESKARIEKQFVERAAALVRSIKDAYPVGLEGKFVGTPGEQRTYMDEFLRYEYDRALAIFEESDRLSREQ